MKREDNKRWIDRYIFHNSICEDIEKIITELQLKQIYDEGLIDEIFNVQKLKAIVQKYGQLPLNMWLIQGTELAGGVDKEMIQYYDQFIFTLKGSHIEKVIEEVEKRLKNNEYCFAGGFGHHVYASYLKLHPHWVIKPKYYDITKLDSIENLAFKIMEKNIHINEQPESERWGN